MNELIAAIASERVQPIVHDQTLDELRRVLAYPQCHLNEVEQRETLDRYRAAATCASMPVAFSRTNLLLPAGFPHCRDSDDDLFLALAFHATADALITKDRALLKLRRKARKFGVSILGPIDLRELRW